jgi:hypothetical protein
MSRRTDKLRSSARDAAADPCVVCAAPSQWSHHVAGHANAPEVTIRVCRRHADVLDAFLNLAGVKLKHGEPRTTAELAWSAVAGLDGLRAARDDKPELSPIALAAARLIATHSADVRGPRPAANDARHRKRGRPVATTAPFEATRARAMHDLFVAFPGVAEQMPDMLAALDVLATNPHAFNALERLDPKAVESMFADFEAAAVQLLDVSRATDAGNPDAQGAVQLVEQHFVRTLHKIAEQIEHPLGESASRSRNAST